MSVLNVSATGLSLCAEQRVDLVQELRVTLELICKGVSFTQGKGNAVSVLNVSATGLSLCTEQRVDFVQDMGN